VVKYWPNPSLDRLPVRELQPVALHEQPTTAHTGDFKMTTQDTRTPRTRHSRRAFLGGTLAGTAAALSWSLRRGLAADGKPILEVGQGTADITPPLGVEMAGFHRPPGQERRVKGIRQPTAVRALALRYRDQQALLVSLDAAALPRDYTARVQQAIAAKTGLAAAHVRLCATHSHSTPTFVKLRQWGGLSSEYIAAVERQILEAVQQAQQDLTPAELFVGQAPTVGGNFNRTTKTWKTDLEFTPESSDDQRWLDTLSTSRPNYWCQEL
ncbi:MAG: neutral/alkaline non-lysosomal ceramidase N-terminal domain-containing protein, partial [bacterium]